MIEKPMDIAGQYPVRKTKKQKQSFRQDVQSYARQLGYETAEEKGDFGATNVVIGNPATARYFITPKNLPIFILCQLAVCCVLIPAVAMEWIGFMIEDSHPLLSLVLVIGAVVVYFGAMAMLLCGPANPSNANDNTSGVVGVMEIARSLPENLRNQVCFVLFDLEELGLIGSASYKAKHKKEVRQQLVLNMDCIGDGDEIWFFPGGKVRKNEKQMALLGKCEVSLAKKTVSVHRKGFAIYPSDQANFPYGVGICALNRKKNILYMSKIHTPKDTTLDETNVNILRAAIISMIGSSAV